MTTAATRKHLVYTNRCQIPQAMNAIHASANMATDAMTAALSQR